MLNRSMGTGKMKRIAVSVVLLFLTASSLLFALSPRTIALDSPLYGKMDLLYLSAGKGTPSNSRPWSADEANLILKRINRESLREGEKRLYDEIASLIEDDFLLILDDVAALDLGADINLEAYVHSNTGYSKESDWIYGYDERKPLLEASFSFEFLDAVYSFCDIRVGNGKYRGSDTLVDIKTAFPNGIGAVIPSSEKIGNDISVNTVIDSSMYSGHFTHNILTSFGDFDSIFPKRAFLNAGGEHYLVSFGRDRIDWGNSNIGNFVVDDHVDYHDYLRFTFFSDRFKYEFLTLFLEYDYSSRQTEDEGSKFLIGHRLEFRVLDTLTFSLSENIMYVSRTGVEFKYFNPAFIFHNLDNHSIFNAIAYVDADWNFAKGFNLYTQFVLDQATAPGEGDDQSPAWGMLLGVEYARILDNGSVKASLEAAYASPLLYRRDAVDFLIIDKNKLSTTGGYAIDVDFLGFPYGNDSFVIQSKTDYEAKPGLDFSFAIQQVIKGSLDIYTSHSSTGNNEDRPDIRTGFLHGALHYATIGTVECDVELNKLTRLSYPDIRFRTALSYIARYSESSSFSDDVQFVVSASVEL